MRNYIGGSWALYKAGLRQVARTSWPWMIAVIMLVVSSLTAFENLFSTPDARQSLSQTIGSNPALNLIFGVPTDLNTAEGFTAWRSAVLGAFLSGLMATFAVVKLTRDKEDSGEAELLRSNVVGRYSFLLVSQMVVLTLGALLALYTAFIAILAGGAPYESLLLGLSMMAASVMFGTVAAVMSQLGSHARTVSSYSISILGLSYLLRGFADTVEEASWLANLSPLGWIQKIDISTTNALWPFWIFAAFSLALLVLALILNSIRDYGQGLIADSPGRERASLAKTAWGLTFKLNRGSFISWTLAFIFVGGMFGYIATSVEDTLGSGSAIQNLVAAGGDLSLSALVLEFLKTLFSILGIIAAVFGVQVIFRLYSEEMNDRVAPLLAGKITRFSFLSSYNLSALIAPSIALVVAGTAVAVVSGIAELDISQADVFTQMLLIIPPTLLLISIGILGVGLAPKIRALAWLAIGISFALTILGPLLELEDRIMAISPYWHVESAGSELQYTQTLVMLGLSSLLIFISYIGFRRRDIARV